MHKYLKAAGFSAFTNESDIYRLLRARVICEENLSAQMALEDGSVLNEYRQPLAEGLVGLCAVVLSIPGTGSEIQYYYPYYNTFELTSLNSCVLERHTSAETFEGLLDDESAGISLIFFVSNSLECRQKMKLNDEAAVNGTFLAAFAENAMVMLPVLQQPDSGEKSFDFMKYNEELIEAARSGDPEAIEELTASDLSMIQQLSERIETEDLYSVVEQSFMPCGVECDQYSIVGEILKADRAVNVLTEESLWLIQVSCNDVLFRICMRAEDLLGEPMPGRRIKCRVWMQGYVTM